MITCGWLEFLILEAYLNPHGRVDCLTLGGGWCGVVVAIFSDTSLGPITLGTQGTNTLTSYQWRLWWVPLVLHQCGAKGGGGGGNFEK